MKKVSLLIPFLIIVITFLVYKPVISFEFTNWDDPKYTFDNDLYTKVKKHKVTDVDNIREFFKTENTVLLHYHPITVWSLALDYKKGYLREKNGTEDIHLSPAPFHRSNLWFHLLNTLLVYLFVYLLWKKNVLIAFFVSFVFALHPMHVESVAWISGRKDLLYVFFLLIASITYLFYISNKRKTSVKIILYLLVFSLYLLSCLAKPQAIVFPLLLVMIDFITQRFYSFADIPFIGQVVKSKKIPRKKNETFPSHKKVNKNKETSSEIAVTSKKGYSWCWEKVPFILVSVYVGLLSMKTQSGGAISDFSLFSFWERLLISTYGWFMYIAKFFVPFNLSAVYPYPDFLLDKALSIPFWFYLPFIVFVLYILILTWGFFKKFSDNWYRIFAFSTLYYLFSVIIVLQFISAGIAIIADRYTYLSYIGLAVGVAGFLTMLTEKKKNILTGIIALIVLGWFTLLGIKTSQRITVWENSGMLWTDVIEKFPGRVDDAYKNRGKYYALQQKEYALAIKDYTELMLIMEKNASKGIDLDKIAKAYTNFGNVHATLADEIRIRATTEASQNNKEGYEKLMTDAMQHYKQAIEMYTLSIRYDSLFPDAYHNMAGVYINSGNYMKAYEILELAGKVDSTFINQHYNYYFYKAYSQFQQAKYTEAISNFTRAYEINPIAQSLYNISVCYLMLGKKTEALQWAMKAKEKGFAMEESYLSRLR